jgi:pSer/pThr/pTyr-binding forkhead associated (FHA) protein
MDRVPELIVEAGAAAGARFDVTDAGLTIGRGDACSIRVTDPGVSREHARVFLHNGAVWVQDTGSRNGLLVNGKRLARPKQLGIGDRVVVGAHTFLLRFKSEGASSAGPEGEPEPPPAPLPEPPPPPDPRVRGRLPVVIFAIVAAAAVVALVLLSE